MKEKIIVFEEIYNYLRPLIKWYQINGYKIYYFRLNGLCKDKRWVKRYIANGALIKIDEKYDILSTFIGMYPDSAYDNIEKIAYFALSDDPIVSMIIKLYNDGSIRDVFKKNLGSELQRFYYLNFILHNLNKVFLDKKIYFAPTLHKEGYRINVIGGSSYLNFMDLVLSSEAGVCENKNFAFPIWFRLASKFYDGWKFFAINLKISSFLFLSLLNSLKRMVNKSERKHYRFGIMIVVPERQFANEVRRVDFLIDEEKIKKEEVLFISWKKLSTSNRRYLIQNNLQFVDGLLSKFSANTFLDIIPPSVSLLSKAIGYRKKMFILEAALLLLICHAMWEAFKSRYLIDNLITHTDFGVQSVARNILLSKDNTRTWYYIDANNWPNYFTANGKDDNICKFGSAHFGYLNYDYLLTWSDEVSDYFKKHRQNIKHYINVGCLWAEHIKEIERGKIKSDFKERVFKLGFKEDHKLVAVFDSTYFDNSITTYEDGIKFLMGILRLLEDISNIFVIFKEKKSRSFVKRYSRAMIDLLEEIDKHPRCFLPFNELSPSEVITFSDLTISFPFTSPTFEALSARKKALYYDASDKFRNTFYDRIPGLVCHSYDELLNKTKKLLFNTVDNEYDRYLDEFVKGRVELYLDGKALTRFRELLTNAKR